MAEKYKFIFKKNLSLMLVLVIVISIGIIAIEIIKNKADNMNIELGGSFLLTDQNNVPFDSKSFNKKKLIYFGYTYCPDVCPFDILKLSKFLDENPSIHKDLKSIFITVDPERDQPDQIKSFLDNFNPSIVGLTGTSEEIKNVVKKYKIYVKKNRSSKNDQNYLVDHSSLFFLVDKNDRYISHFRPDDFDSKIKSTFLKKIF